MSAEYTPTTAEVQRSYTETIRLGQSSDEWVQEVARKVAEFDRWLGSMLVGAFDRGFEMADKTRRALDAEVLRDASEDSPTSYDEWAEWLAKEKP